MVNDLRGRVELWLSYMTLQQSWPHCDVKVAGF
jgi:hypothetical protein